ncbi:MAG: methylenetetrahydrofolate--tRNA-(uracil(54)-C(5))-methyltransferase (FADH(2)-oxidizing) TrmFO [Deltaproteobacteria bacterium]|nr:methylenetetrahydrofolate--tRNA-(uracil(54)-C(5))-methyltransferase (FADH(2)-oxidizing) TrmFO [Deltaproteobacteria bacterium]MCR5220541.1 methylenetetrahydrofolate--tRNA-(uracil(54)-C(5))-methyltransferase (FADH(2)-oxidizing) TrmFO [bacterium]
MVEAQAPVVVVGGGLAGCEAAWQIACCGLDVRLYEMKPRYFSPAHKNADLAELVCSNSLRGASLANAVGCLKEELRHCGALLMEAAQRTQVEAGGSLAVDRERFSACITARIEQNPHIEVVRERLDALPESGTVILATGPLSAEPLLGAIRTLAGTEDLYFYDAIAPIVEASSLDFSKVWWASRYDKGGADYLNCPLSEEEYRHFVEELCHAESVPYHAFEQARHFEGCMPVEVLAARGPMTLAFGPLKPVGLRDPHTGRQPFAVVQLRKENRAGTLFNLVGFQTRLTYPEQRRVFRMIPGLENAVFTRLGSMHRNTFVNAPRCLRRDQRFVSDGRIYCAGQLSGVEGYVESAASGFLAGLAAACAQKGIAYTPPPATTALGALLAHLTESDPQNFQPSNVNYGLFAPLEAPRPRGRSNQRLAMAERALRDVALWWSSFEENWRAPV